MGRKSRSVALRAQGVSLVAVPRPKGGLQLSLSWRGSRGRAHFHAIARMDELRADHFFAELAHACGYQVSYRPKGGRIAFCSSVAEDEVIVGIVHAAKDDAPTLSCTVLISARQASRLLRHLARPLGWDLDA